MTLEAPTSSRFCRILADARHFKLPGYWEGSAYRSHPCGVIRDGLILTNEWNVHDYCSAQVMLDPTSPIKPIFNGSRYNGDPHAYPERGGTLTVYNGTWSKDDGPWREKIVAMLADLEVEIAQAREIETAEKEAKEQEIKNAHNERVEAARNALEAEE